MIRPLTKKDQYGTPYRRPAEVEKAIDVATQQDIVTLRERAVVWKPDSPNFIPMECLVYIIREGGRGHEEQTMSVLLPLLLARCEAILKKKILDSDMPNAAEIREKFWLSSACSSPKMARGTIRTNSIFSSAAST